MTSIIINTVLFVGCVRGLKRRFHVLWWLLSRLHDPTSILVVYSTLLRPCIRLRLYLHPFIKSVSAFQLNWWKLSLKVGSKYIQMGVLFLECWNPQDFHIKMKSWALKILKSLLQNLFISRFINSYSFWHQISG